MSVLATIGIVILTIVVGALALAAVGTALAFLASMWSH